MRQPRLGWMLSLALGLLLVGLPAPCPAEDEGYGGEGGEGGQQGQEGDEGWEGGEKPAGKAHQPPAEGDEYGETELPPGYRTHDGFFVRGATGFGWAYSREAVSDNAVSLQGFAALEQFSIGYAIIENLVLSFDLFASMVFSPIVTQGGHTDTVSGTLEDLGLGGGVTYYFMPLNFFLSLSAGMSELVARNDWGFTASSRIGWGVSLMAGKEWWIGPNWGIGVAALTFFTMAPDRGSSATLFTVAGGALFTATYN